MAENSSGSFFRTVLLGGLTVGILDGIFAVVFYGGVLGSSFARIFQTISAGILGKDAYSMGTATVISGIILHFVVASAISAVYWFLSRKIPFLLNHPVISGLIYGMGAFLVMNYIVIPLSRLESGKFSLMVFTVGIIGHAFLVGLPLALIARQTLKEIRPK